MSSQNDNANTHVERPQQRAEAPQPVEQASHRGANEAYKEMDRQQGGGNSSSDHFNTSTDNARTAGNDKVDNMGRKLDAFGKPETGDQQTETGTSVGRSTRPGERQDGRPGAEPESKGIDTMEVGENGKSTFKYHPEQRDDRMATRERTLGPDGAKTQVDTFDGRQDGLTRQEMTEKGKSIDGKREYAPGSRPDGLLNETVHREKGSPDFNATKNYDAQVNPNHLSQETIARKGNEVTTERTYNGRQDGLLNERSVKTADGEHLTQKFNDNTRVEKVTTADGKVTTTAYDAEGKVLPNGRPEARTEGQERAKETPDAKDPKKVEEHLKKFEENLRKDNGLGEIRKGEGPYQALQRGVKEGKIPPMTPKEMLTEARRIRDRDLQGDKKHYKVGDKVERHSDKEIKDKVEAERKRITGEGGTPRPPEPHPDPDFRTPGPDERRTTPEERRTTPEERRTTPEERRTTPEERRTTPEERRTTPEQPKDRTTPEEPRDRTEPRDKTEQLTPEQRELQQSRERLNQAADKHITNPEDRKKFADNMKAFEERAKRENLKPEEVTKTYNALEKMMTAPNKEGLPNQEQRAILAQNFMHHAKNPENIDQGRFNTCNVTTIQEKVMTQNPSKAAEMLSEGTTTGKYTAPDGKEIKLDPRSMQPVDGVLTKTNPDPSRNERSYGTQVLNHIMANEITQRRQPPEFYTQLQGQENGKPLRDNDNGERLRRDGFDGPNKQEWDDKQKKQVDMRHPNIYPEEMAGQVERLTGEKDTVLYNREFGRTINGPHTGEPNWIKSPEDLRQAIEKAQREGKTLILRVNGDDPVFQGGTGNPKEDGGHVVTIRGFDPETGKVRVSNQWGGNNDRQIDLNKLYETTQRFKPQPQGDQRQGQEQQKSRGFSSYDYNPVLDR